MTQAMTWQTAEKVRRDSLVVLCRRRDLVLGVGRPVAQDGAVDGLGVGAVGAVPAVATLEPRQLAGHGGEQVVEGPGDDDVVVEANVQGDDDDCVSHTCRASTRCECRRPTSHGALGFFRWSVSLLQWEAGQIDSVQKPVLSNLPQSCPLMCCSESWDGVFCLQWNVMNQRSCEAISLSI